MEKVVNIENLEVVRDYFSHNIRTSTAMVVATVMVLKYGLSDGSGNASDIISESAYFLDVYDKGMEICFDFVLGKKIKNNSEVISLSKITKHFEGKLPITILEQGIELSLNLKEVELKSNNHVLKSLLEIILCEEIAKAKGKLTITSNENEYIIEKSVASLQLPDIYNIFKDMFKELGMQFSFDKYKTELRFNLQ